jgi:hypothetical protein
VTSAPESGVQLRVLSVAEVAAMLGWGERRTRRWLVGHNVKLGGKLLVNRSAGARRKLWCVSVEALKQLAPQWFASPEQVEVTLEEHEKRLTRLERGQTILEEAVRRLSQ